MTAWMRERSAVLSTWLVGILMFAFAAKKYKGFATLLVGMNLLNDNAYLGILALGLTFVILMGGIDLSVGSMVGLSGILMAFWTEKAHLNPFVAVLGVLAVGLAVGGVQGYLIAKFKLAPFLVTLGGLFFCRGIALAISKESIGIENPVISSWTAAKISLPGGASLSAIAILMLALVALGTFVLKQTRYGRTLYAIGGNENSAHLMGLRVQSTVVWTYAACGFCAALAGIVFGVYMSSGNAIGGTGMELDAIAAVVIGGTLLTGGSGSVVGTLMGVLVLGMIQTMITFEGTLSSWWTKIAIGALLLAFLLLQRALNPKSV